MSGGSRTLEMLKPHFTVSLPSIPQPTFWDRLDTEARINSVDTRYVRPYGFLHAWDCKGKVSHYWNDHLEPMVKDLVNAKWSSIFRGMDWDEDIPCWMIGQNPESATLTIVFTCKEQAIYGRLGKHLRAAKWFTQSGFDIKGKILKTLKGVRYTGENWSGVPTGGNAFEEISDIHDADSSGSSYWAALGADIWFSREGQVRRATLGAILSVGETYYGLSAGHPFASGFRPRSSDQFASADTFRSVPEAMTGPLSSLDSTQDSKYRSKAGMATSDDVTYLDEDFLDQFESWEDVNMSAPVPFPGLFLSENLLGSRQPTLSLREGSLVEEPRSESAMTGIGDLGFHWLDHNCDWALFRLNEAAAKNFFNVFKTDRLLPKFPAYAAEVTDRPFPRSLVVASQSGNYQRVFCSNNRILISPPGSDKLVSAWALDPFPKGAGLRMDGESGSLVMDPEAGTVWGMIVARSLHSHQRYFIPTGAIVDSISAKFGRPISIPRASQDIVPEYDFVKVVRTANLKMLAFLLRQGTDPDYKVDSDNSLLNVACKSGHIEVVDLLLSYGANIDSIDSTCNPLQTAIIHGHDKIVEKLLSRGANVKVVSAGLTPLHAAVISGHGQYVDRLIARGAKVNALSTFGTVLQLAQVRHDKKLVETLVSRGALLESDLSSRSNDLGTRNSKTFGFGHLPHGLREASLPSDSGYGSVRSSEIANSRPSYFHVARPARNGEAGSFAYGSHSMIPEDAKFSSLATPVPVGPETLNRSSETVGRLFDRSLRMSPMLPQLQPLGNQLRRLEGEGEGSKGQRQRRGAHFGERVDARGAKHD